MSSSKDLRDIMSISEGSRKRRRRGDTPPPALPRELKTGSLVYTGKKSDAMRRELLALMGDKAPSVEVAPSRPVFKERIRPGNDSAVRWTWTPFMNEARDPTAQPAKSSKPQEPSADMSLAESSSSNADAIDAPSDEAGEDSMAADAELNVNATGDSEEAGNDGAENGDTAANDEAKDEVADGHTQGTSPSWMSSTLAEEDGQTSQAENKSRAGADLVLYHWVKNVPADYDPKTTPYPFAKYNVQPDIMTYTNEEYDRLLKADNWTRADTDRLMELAQTYNQRFPVIADRWDGSAEKSLDELRARYSSVCRRLIRARPLYDESQRPSLLERYSFDLKLELERKDYVRSLLNRTPEQVAEEEYLYVELKRLGDKYGHIQREREELLSALGIKPHVITEAYHELQQQPSTRISFPTAVPPSRTPLNLLPQTPPPTSKGTFVNANDSFATSTALVSNAPIPEGWQGQGAKRKPTPAFDAANCIERHPLPAVAGADANMYPSVSMRSQRIPPVRSNAIAKVNAVLTELGVSQRLTMPTSENIQKLEQLKNTAILLADLKRSLDRSESELQVYKRRLQGQDV